MVSHSENCLPKINTSPRTYLYKPLNGVAKYKNRTIMNRVQAILIGGHVSKFIWPEATQVVVHLTNFSPTHANLAQIPESCSSTNEQDLSSLWVFGSLTYMHHRKNTRD